METVKIKDFTEIINKQTGELLPYIKSKDIFNYIPEIYSLYNKLKSKSKKDGRYMIKKFELKYNKSFIRIAFAKTYFCGAESGICYSYDKKYDKILRINNKAEIIRIAKLLVNSSENDLFTVVDRKTGEHTFIVHSGMVKRRSKIYVKI